MISRHVDEALCRARGDKLDDGTFYAEVPELRGVLASGETREERRNQLAEVVEGMAPGARRRRGRTRLLAQKAYLGGLE